MGRPFKHEIDLIPATYQWAKTKDVNGIAHFVERIKNLSLLSIGSGGSLTTAIFASLIHQETGMMSQFATPLEAVYSDYNMRRSAILVASGMGRNQDVITCTKAMIGKEPDQGLVLCATTGSPLARIAREAGWDVAEFDTPAGKEGFLAVNSIIGSATLLTRAYSKVIYGREQLPEELDSVANIMADPVRMNVLESGLRKALTRDTFIVLYGKWGKPAAFDLESKCAEAALANVMLADYRNFAHGRHYWLAKRGDASTIISFVTPDEEDIAERTLNLVPSEIPKIRLSTKEKGPIAGLGLLVKTMNLVKLVGSTRGQDPGRPSIPRFGRRIYHLTPSHRLSSPRGDNPVEFAAIRRKMMVKSNAWNPGVLRYWRNALRKFTTGLEKTMFQGIVFDYDGTLCDPRDRFSGVSKEVANSLQSLLRGKILVGIATGRGISVRDSLRNAMDKTLWNSILIGYYNGSDIGTLDDDMHPIKEGPIDPSLKTFMSRLRNDPHVLKLVDIEQRPKQISLQPRLPLTVDELISSVSSIAKRDDSQAVRIVTSSHSVDLLAPGVSKVHIVEAIRRILTRREAPVLCIGDKGEWPGNDFELLAGQYSLSVDSVSSDPGSCWNLAPPGYRGVRATLAYLDALDIKNQFFAFAYSRLRSRDA